MALAADVSLDTFTRTLAVNLTGTFLAIRHVLPELERTGGGAIVTVASTAALRGHGRGAGYTASKGGVVALTRLVAFQYAGRGIRANCVCPGITDTSMTGRGLRDDATTRRLVQGVPLGRMAEPEEIGAVVAFLCSQPAAFVNGVNLVVDGAHTRGI